MPDLDALSWHDSYIVGSAGLGYTPKFCAKCGSELRHHTKSNPKSMWKFDPRTGKALTDVYTTHYLSCPTDQMSHSSYWSAETS